MKFIGFLFVMKSPHVKNDCFVVFLITLTKLIFLHCPAKNIYKSQFKDHLLISKKIYAFYFFNLLC